MASENEKDRSLAPRDDQRASAQNSPSKRELAHKILTVEEARTAVLAGISFAMNALYALGNLILGALGASAWFVTMGAYYLVIATSRLLVVRREVARGAKAADRTDTARREARTTRVVGVLMMAMTVVLGGMVLLTVARGFEAPKNEVLVITIATYTFVKVGMAVRGRILSRGAASDPLLKTIRSLSLVDALVSLLSLQATMLDTFGGGERFRTVMTAATGAAVCAVSLVAGALLVTAGRRTS